MKEITILKKSEPADACEIEEFENEYSFCIPDEYKEFLLNTNVISIQESLFKINDREFWVSDFYPFDKEYELSVQMVHRQLGGFFDNNYLAFANDAGGWQFIISLKEEDYGKVYFCRMDEALEDALTLLANDFTEFINGLQIAEEIT